MNDGEIRKRIYRYCAYQERPHSDVRKKLLTLGMRGDALEEMMAHLIKENFLNEERFARAYVGGKFRLKQWGKIRIIKGLENKGLTSNGVRIGLQEIEDADYRDTLVKLIRAQSERIDEDNIFRKRDKLSKYAIRKGFEPELVWDEIRRLL